MRVAEDDRDREFGGDVAIDAWTRFDFPGRDDVHSDFKWRWFHFDGVDWAQNLGESSLFKFRGTGKAWDWRVDTENRNYDYLMFADLDLDHPDVIAELRRWGEWYLEETGVDGFRIDAVKHISFPTLSPSGWLICARSAATSCSRSPSTGATTSASSTAISRPPAAPSRCSTRLCI